MPIFFQAKETIGQKSKYSFDSLEDKIIKNFFNTNKDFLKILTKKPITPDEREMKVNPRSRSARMRVAEIL